jgi:hypothetical protein
MHMAQANKPLSGKEYAALQSFFAAISHMAELIPYLKARAHMVPNLWRDLRMIETRLQTILDQLLLTVPPEKLRHISQDIRNTSLYIKVEAPGIRTQSTEGFSYTPTKVLNQLLAYMCEHECMMCDKTPTEARRCPYRQILDNALPHEIKARDRENCKYADFVIGIEDEDTDARGA